MKKFIHFTQELKRKDSNFVIPDILMTVFKLITKLGRDIILQILRFQE